ncbi:hypothetical protein JW964_25875, partial [candidate division KSB1 bacterium]|nr:hypothetical protein [candidate division KSB1 bacterium]
MRTIKLMLLILFVLPHFILASQNDLTVKDALKLTKIISYPKNGKPVNKTVAEELKSEIIQHAKILTVNQNSKIEESGVLRIEIADEKLTPIPKNLIDQKDWMFFQLDANGNGDLIASKPNLLYALFCQIKEDWLDSELSEFENGKILKPKF